MTELEFVNNIIAICNGYLKHPSKTFRKEVEEFREAALQAKQALELAGD